MFEDSGDDLEEFAHEGSEDGFGGFAGGAEAAAEVDEAVVLFGAVEHEGGHVEGFAQAGVALFVHPALAFLLPGVFEGGGEAGPGGEVAHAGKAVHGGHFREHGAGGGGADAGDAEEVVVGGVEGEVAFDDGGELAFEGGDLSLEMGDGELAVAGGLGGALEAEFFGDEHAGEFFAAAVVGAEFALGGTEWFPGAGGVGGEVAGDDAGVGGIGFVAAAFAAGVVFDPTGIEEAGVVAVGVEVGEQWVAVAAGGFEAGAGGGGVMLLEPGGELGEAGGVVGEVGFVGGLAGDEEAGAEGGFGDVDPEHGQRGHGGGGFEEIWMLEGRGSGSLVEGGFTAVNRHGMRWGFGVGMGMSGLGQCLRMSGGVKSGEVHACMRAEKEVNPQRT